MFVIAFDSQHNQLIFGCNSPMAWGLLLIVGLFHSFNRAVSRLGDSNSGIGYQFIAIHTIPAERLAFSDTSELLGS